MGAARVLCYITIIVVTRMGELIDEVHNIILQEFYIIIGPGQLCVTRMNFLRLSDRLFGTASYFQFIIGFFRNPLRRYPVVPSFSLHFPIYFSGGPT